jgi:hypothetical protein
MQSPPYDCEERSSKSAMAEPINFSHRKGVPRLPPLKPLQWACGGSDMSKSQRLRVDHRWLAPSELAHERNHVVGPAGPIAGIAVPQSHK